MASFEVKTADDVIIVRADNIKECRSYVQHRFSPSYGYSSCPKFSIRKISDGAARNAIECDDVVDWWL